MPRPPHKLTPVAERRLRRAATAFVVFVALAAAVLSFAGLHQLALVAGFHPYIAWLFPVATDVAVAAFSLAVVHHTLTGMRVWYPWLCMLLAIGVSVAGNVWAAPDDLVSRLVHAWPPVVFALAFEALARLLRHRIEAGVRAVRGEGVVGPEVGVQDAGSRDGGVAGVSGAEVDVSERAPELTPDPDPVPSAERPPAPASMRAPAAPTLPQTAKSDTPKGVKEQRVPAKSTPKASQPKAGGRRTLRERLVDLLQEGEDLTHAEMARRLGADRSNVSKAVRKLRVERPDLFEGESS